MVNSSMEITPEFDFQNSQPSSLFRFEQAFENLQDILRKQPKHYSLEATLPQALKTPPTQIIVPLENFRTPTSQINPINP
jgi:hypothetical protein